MTTLLPLLASCSPRPREQTSEDYAADLHKALQGEIGNAASGADVFAGAHATPAMRRAASPPPSSRQSNQPFIRVYEE